jgi:hypothetical protein
LAVCIVSCRVVSCFILSCLVSFRFVLVRLSSLEFVSSHFTLCLVEFPDCDGLSA